MQGFVLNMRRPQFQDRRVREALTYAFDFESMNRTLFYGLYTRTDSYFEGGELASSGLPPGKELEILNAVQGQAAARAVHQGVQAAGLRHAAGDARESAPRLRAVQGGRLGSTRTASWSRTRPASSSRSRFLGDDPTDERIAEPFIEQSAQARHRRLAAHRRQPASTSTASAISTSTCVTAVLAQSQSPGNEQRDFWSVARRPIRRARAT